jgi:cell wall-associated NlpC family hydrolase
MIATTAVPAWSAAHELIGAPYAYGARGPDAFDCWGLVLEMRRRLGLPLPPDFASRTLASEDVRRLFVAGIGEAPAGALTGWAKCTATDGAVAYVHARAHAGVVLRGRVVHAVIGAGVVSWSLAMWRSTYGAAAEFYECRAR